MWQSARFKEGCDDGIDKGLLAGFEFAAKQGHITSEVLAKLGKLSQHDWSVYCQETLGGEKMGEAVTWLLHADPQRARLCQLLEPLLLLQRIPPIDLKSEVLPVTQEEVEAVLGCGIKLHGFNECLARLRVGQFRNPSVV